LRFILTNPVYTAKVYAGRTRRRPPRIRRSATRSIGRPSNTAVAVAPEEWIPVTTVPAIVTQEQFDYGAFELNMEARMPMETNVA
jgi:site-specific DNA recombinase